MEGEVSGDDVLMQKLKKSRHRFQRHMQQLLEKYNQPFEDAPVVQMSTLTYETPQGLRIWGGRLEKEKSKGQIQNLEGSPEQTVGRRDGAVQATAGGDELPVPYTQDLGEDSKSSDLDATLYQEDLAAGALMPAVPWSPLKDDLRRKYLTQVDILLQDKGCAEYDHGDGNDTCVTLVPSLASPPRPAHGYCGHVSEDSPFEPAASSRLCSPDTVIVPRNDSVSLQETSSHSFLSSQSFVAGDICNVTISDLYAGMLHSMSRLLSSKPSCVISTKTFIVRNWSSRRRHGCKSRMNRTYCRGGRHARRDSQETLVPCSEPVKEAGVLRESQNFRDLSGQKAGLKLEKAFPEVNKLQISKELKGTPRKLSSLTYVDSSVTHRLDRENRLMTLKWLISPVKVVSRPRMLQGEGGNHYGAFDSKFKKLHQKYCPSPRKQLGLTYLPSSSSFGVDVLRSGLASPRSPQGLETHRPSRPLSKAKVKSLNEAFKNLGKWAIETGRCLPQSDSSASFSKTDPTWSPGCSDPTADLFRENPLGILRESAALSKAISVPGVHPLGSARDRYDGIREKFDQLHQQYCQKSPQRAKVPFCAEASPDEASVEVQNQTEAFFKKLDPDSGLLGPRKLSSSLQRSIRSSRDSTTVEPHPSPWFELAASCRPQPHAKRRRLSDPQVCGRWAESQDPSRMVGRAFPRPGKEVCSSPDWERKRKEHIFQDGR
ncbi:Holliday junction recognition protein isoform X1 [Myotis lucifugus]|uniref:Holliday junction recognition protein isoform X1 n=1 Tax=Myotis lucifugus TaxID=59463 RepID=UPI000CCC6BA0|nr:Holliday junction recognition protein isoform X1 [Myotis lucifugus]